MIAFRSAVCELPTSSTERELAGAIEAVAARLEPDVDALARALVEHMLREIPDLAADEAIVGDLEPAVRATLVSWLGMVRRGLRAAEMAPPDDVLALARGWILRGTPLLVLLRAYRLGHGLVMREWLAALQSAGYEAAALGVLMERALELSFTYVDAMSVQVSEFYAAERARLVRSADVVRAETVRALLSGEPVDVDAASFSLGHELRRRHIGMVLWSDSPADPQDRLRTLEAAAHEVAAGVGGGRPLVVPAGRGMIWCWCTTAGPVLPEALTADTRARRLRDGVSVAIGQSGEGVEGFVRSHAEAVEARRVAVLARPAGSITLFADVDLVALLTRDPERARRFVEDQLGPLAAVDDATARNRATLRVYLEEGHAFVATARRLGIHENTVKYRMRRCEELLGRSIDDQPLKLGAALLLADILHRASSATHNS